MTYDALERETIGGFTIKYYHDHDCESPLDNDDDVHITYNKSARYTLGNEPLDEDAQRDIAARISAGELIGLPVYAYIHSGVALNTGGFSCPWDSGQSGFVYVTRQTALEWHGKKHLTKAIRARVLESLTAIVQEFGRYCNGECYGYVIENADGAHVDSCYGYIGFEYVKQEAHGALEIVIQDDREQRRQAWRAALREARERAYWEARDVTTEEA